MSVRPTARGSHGRALIALATILVGCEGAGGSGGEPEPSEPERTEAETAEAAPEGPPPAEPIPDRWVAKRVAEARERLQGSEGGRLVWSAIEAHGGLAAWLDKGTIAFEFDYRPLGKPARRMHTRNQVDLWRARARQKELGQDADAVFGWNGEVAWIVPGPDAFPSPARFWATTPYYFVGIPWVLADPGTVFDTMEDAELDGEAHHVVRVGYEEGVGDSPDDYYILYVHPETRHVNAIRYVVAYPGFFSEGEHSPEKLMTYLDQKEVQGLRFAHRYEAFSFDQETGEAGDPIKKKVTEVDIGGIRLGESWPASIFEPPEGAEEIREIAPPQPEPESSDGAGE